MLSYIKIESHCAKLSGIDINAEAINKQNDQSIIITRPETPKNPPTKIKLVPIEIKFNEVRTTKIERSSQTSQPNLISHQRH